MRTEGAAVAAVLVALTLLDVALAAAMDKKGEMEINVKLILINKIIKFPFLLMCPC